MAIIERKLDLSPSSQALKVRLVKELESPNPGTEPFIILESEGSKNPIYVYVVWSDWSTLEMDERTRIIMEAYEEARGAQACFEVVTFLGLTPQEAPRFGIDYNKDLNHD
jgi:hypothetical protein